VRAADKAPTRVERRRLRRPWRLAWLLLPLAAVVALVFLTARPHFRPATGTGTPSHRVGALARGARSGRGGHVRQGKGGASAATGYRVVQSSGQSVTLSARAPVRVTLAFQGRCWVSATVDGVKYPGAIYQGGARLDYTVGRQGSFVLGLPANANVTVDGEAYPTSGAIPLTLTVRAE
jgi:hypothetical protein